MVQGEGTKRLDGFKAANKFPNATYAQYRTDIEAFVDETEDRFNNIWQTSLKRNVQLITDADQDRVERDLDRVEETFTATITALAMKGKIERMANSASQKAISGLRQELQVMLGDNFVPPINRMRLDKFIKQTISENVSLINSIATDQHDEIERLIYEGAKSGWSMDELEGKIFNQFEISRGRANVIAMDQVGSLQGSVNRDIQKNQLGLELFRWLSVADDRVRPEHRQIASNQLGEDYYRWSDPPHGKYPGISDVNCRCYAAPVSDEVKKKFKGRVNIE